jgi:hypothetical protein
MVRGTDQIVVAFEGDGCGVDELSWGQLDIWTAMIRQNSWLPLGGVKSLARGTRVEDIVDELRYLMSRYQSMRTRLRFDADGLPRQVLASRGEIMLEVVDADDDEDPEQVAEAVCQRFKEREYEHATDWPPRLAVIRHHGVPTHLSAIICHLATDGLGAATMMAEVAAREPAPVGGMQPLEQTQWQRSPAGRRQNEAALRYWESQLRAIPKRRWDLSSDRRQPRHWHGEFTSPALLLATRAITERARVDSAPVLLAAFAVALARVAGTNPVVVRPVVSNRFRPGLAGVVAPVSQAGLCVLDVADGSFHEALHRVHRSALAAYKYAYYHRADLEELIAHVARERGHDLDIGCFYNDRRISNRDEANGPEPAPGELREALPHTEFRWIGARDDPFERLFVHIDDVPGTLRLTLHLDTHFLSPADGMALMHGIEAVAVEAAATLAVPTLVTGPATAELAVERSAR